ncbi:MAG: hypothetical protein HY074_16395 [Deltaproteobacteria bacterium]|nr:hypothetical protein [Deltaproteobacteria bacterium]
MFSGQTYDGGNVTFRSKRRTSSIADLSGALTLSPGTAASLGLRTRILGISFDLYALSNVLYFGTIYLVTTKDGFGHCHGIRFDVVPGQTAELDQPKPQASTVDSGAGLKEVQTNDQGGALEKKEIAAPVLPAN